MTQLKRLGLPVICIDARRAKRRIKQAGWFEEISVKDLDGHSVRALLASLTLLVKINQIRGLLKNLGLAIGRPKFNVFAARAEELIEDRPELIAAVGPPTLILAEMLS